MIRIAKALTIAGILSISATNVQSFTVDDVIYDVMVVKCYALEVRQSEMSDSERVKARMELSIMYRELGDMYGQTLIEQAAQYIAYEFGSDDAQFAEACSRLE